VVEAVKTQLRDLRDTPRRREVILKNFKNFYNFKV